MPKVLYLVFVTAIISGVANFVNKLVMSDVGGGAYVYTTAKNLLVAVILGVLILTPNIWQKIKLLNKKERLLLILIGLIGGSISFLLFFQGLSLTSAVSASFVHKTLFIWATILAYFFLKERLGKIQLLAIGLLFFGNLVLDGFSFLKFGVGELLIFIATIMWALEYVIIKKYLEQVDYKIIAWGRMFLGAIFLVLFLLGTNNFSGLLDYPGYSWLLISIASVLLLGYVLTWYNALQKLPVTIVASILVIASPITTLLNNIFIVKKYTLLQFFGSAFIVLGVFLCVKYFYSIKSNVSVEKENNL